MALVDIVIPNYQYGRYLRQCVESALAQGVKDLRILIIDNASTDNSVEIARALRDEDPRIKIRARSKNLGPVASFNEGIDWAQSEYFMILSADDYLTQGALKRAIAVLDANKQTAFAYGACAQDRGRGVSPATEITHNHPWRIEAGAEFIRRYCKKYVYVMAPLVRTSIQKRAGYYNPRLPYNTDVEILLRLARLGDTANTQALHAVQRIHVENVSNALWNDPVLSFKQSVNLFESFFTDQGKDMPEAALLHRLARRSIVKGVCVRTIRLLLHGRHRDAARLVKFALSPQLSPFRRFTCYTESG